MDNLFLEQVNCIRDSEQAPTPYTARFYEFINGSPVKISVRDGETLIHLSGGLTEEGSRYETTAWTFQDGVLISQRTVCTRDCDGRFDEYSAVRCPADKLKAGVIDSDFRGVVYPQWQQIARSQRDHSAEAMGY